MNYRDFENLPCDGDTVDRVDRIISENFMSKPVPFAGLPHTDKLSLLAGILKDDAFDIGDILHEGSFDTQELLSDMIKENISAEEFKKAFISGLEKDHSKMFTGLIANRLKRVHGSFDDESDCVRPGDFTDPAYNNIWERRRII